MAKSKQKYIHVVTTINSDDNTILNQKFFANKSEVIDNITSIHSRCNSIEHSTCEEKYHDLDGHLVQFRTNMDYIYSLSEHEIN